MAFKGRLLSGDTKKQAGKLKPLEPRSTVDQEMNQGQGNVLAWWLRSDHFKFRAQHEKKHMFKTGNRHKGQGWLGTLQREDPGKASKEPEVQQG